LVIANDGGACIQEESDALREMATSINEGDVFMIKKVGNLPCNSLIHIVCPYWKGGTQNEETLLKNACLKALEKAQNFQTISFPPIGFDTHSFPISLCAENIVKSVVDFSQQNPACSLSEVAFVLYHQFEVDAFCKGMSQVFNSPNVATGTIRTVINRNLTSEEDNDFVVKEKDFVIKEEDFIVEDSIKKDSVVPENQSAIVSSSNVNIDITQYVQVCKGDVLNQQVSV